MRTLAADRYRQSCGGEKGDHNRSIGDKQRGIARLQPGRTNTNKVFAVLALTGVVLSATAFADGMKLPEFKKQPTPQAVLDQHLDALNKCDWNRIMAQFPDDVEFLLPNGVWIKGRAEAGNMFVGFCKDHRAGGFKGATFIPEESVPVGDTIGVSWRRGGRLAR